MIYDHKTIRELLARNGIEVHDASDAALDPFIHLAEEVRMFTFAEVIAVCQKQMEE